MKKQKMYMIAAILFIAVIVAAAPQLAQAANTTAGTSITNTATVNYSVSGVPQTAVTGSVNFVVDRVINFTVTQTANVTSAPSSTFQAIQFIVSNTSNTTMRFALVPESRAANPFNLTSPAIYRDNNNSGTWDAGDTLYADAATFGNIASGATITVLIVGDIPGTATNGQIAQYDLLATAVDADTTNPSTQTGGAGTMGGVDTVFADAAGTSLSGGGDNARDGKHSAVGTFTITAAGVSVSKTAAVYWDPVNLLAAPKAIPGAIVTYTVTVTNAAGGANATNVSITDNLNAEIVAGRVAFNTQFADGAPNCAPGQGVVVAGACNSNGADADNGDWNVSGANTVTVSGLTINAGSSVTIKYQVTVQ